jgi:hypothetical protein
MELVQEESNMTCTGYSFIIFPSLFRPLHGVIQSTYRMDCIREMFLVFVEAGTSVKDHRNPELTCQL